MKKRHLIAIGAIAILLAACIPSVNPFYTDKDVVFDPHLVGEWQEKEKTTEPQVWKFEQSTNNSYQLTVVHGGETGHFIAHLLKLKKDQFLDLIPADCNYASNQVDLVAAAMFPGHLLLRVGQIDPELKLAPCDYDWLEKFLQENPKAVGHHVEDGPIILTAETPDLQKFVLKHLGTNELFKQYVEMVRR